MYLNDGFDNLIYENYFELSSFINFKMKDQRSFNYCEICKIYKLPRMHHCSQCNACSIKYDHHCGMVMNCIGVNNYHLFLHYIFSVSIFMAFNLYLNLKYNFYQDFIYSN